MWDFQEKSEIPQWLFLLIIFPFPHFSIPDIIIISIKYSFTVDNQFS